MTSAVPFAAASAQSAGAALDADEDVELTENLSAMVSKTAVTASSAETARTALSVETAGTAGIAATWLAASAAAEEAADKLQAASPL
mmetsp:Transcript_46250/g.83322  ORF Transcript_46250/g.83322 Transcript_46250/m.83322 type:complete len:87 (-) Transcript_46250:715-975(-)